MNYSNEKNKLRATWKTKRRELFCNSLENVTDLFLGNFISIAGDLEGKIIAGYNPIGSEVNCLGILEYALSAGALTSLPYVNKNNIIEFREWRNGDELKPDNLKILSPSKNKILIPDIILIPLLSFDLNGNRLGMGGGIYDRTLPFFDLSDKFGLAFSGQQANQIHKEDHDFSIDCVITEKGVIIFKGKKV